jgi:hypothetical protein
LMLRLGPTIGRMPSASQELKALKFRLVFHVKPGTLQHKARLVLDEDNKMDADAPITTNVIHTDSEVSFSVPQAHLPIKAKTGPKQKSRQGKKQEPKPKPSKGKSNKGKFPKKANKFSTQNPAAYVTAAVWKRMTKEEQQAARAGRRELGIETRSDNLPATLQPPDLGKADEVSSKGTTIDLCGVPTPLPVKEKRRTRILTQLELQQEQIMELKRQMQELQRR